MPTFRNSTVPGEDHAILGVADKGIGVHGTSNTSTGTGGVSQSGIGVHGVSTAGPGVRGDAENGVGVFGGSKTSTAVGGISDSGIGLHGFSKTADGVFGISENGRGVVGVAKGATGVEGNSTSGAGVFGSSETDIGVHGKGGRLAGLFEGDIEVTGHINGSATSKVTCFDVSLIGADCAEDFDIADPESIGPGTVMVLGEEDGVLHQSRQAYDKRVAGVVSGAGNYKPGIVLGKQQSRSDRKPIALVGKVFCKVDASHAQIEVGDLLTTSPTPGHAMKASDPLKAFGAVIGKALCPLKEGQALVPILIALQ